MPIQNSIFSLTRGEEKIEVFPGPRGTFDVSYQNKKEDPIVVNLGSLKLAMEMVRSLLDDTALDQ